MSTRVARTILKNEMVAAAGSRQLDEDRRLKSLFAAGARDGAVGMPLALGADEGNVNTELSFAVDHNVQGLQCTLTRVSSFGSRSDRQHDTTS